MVFVPSSSVTVIVVLFRFHFFLSHLSFSRHWLMYIGPPGGLWPVMESVLPRCFMVTSGMSDFVSSPSIWSVVQDPSLVVVMCGPCISFLGSGLMVIFIFSQDERDSDVSSSMNVIFLIVL